MKARLTEVDLTVVAVADYVTVVVWAWLAAADVRLVAWPTRGH